MNIPQQYYTPPDTQPADGLGGSYYNTSFFILVYSPNSTTVFKHLDWLSIDRFVQGAAIHTAISALCLGICAITLLNIAVLTPSHKRALPLHNLLLLADVLSIIRFSADLALQSNGPLISSYLYLTRDLEAGSYSTTLKVQIDVRQIFGLLAFICAQLCFYIQAKGLLIWTRLNFPACYAGVMGYLILAGFVAAVLKIASSIVLMANIQDNISEESDTYHILQTGASIASAISISSWSMVFLGSSVSIMINRKRLDQKRNVYDSALNFVAIIGVESFILPVICCILQIIPGDFLIPQPEQLVIPLVLFLLPIGSLYASVHSNNNKTAQHKHPPHYTTLEDLTQKAPSDVRTVDNPATAAAVSSMNSIDRELEFIDAMDVTPVEQSTGEHKCESKD